MTATREWLERLRAPLPRALEEASDADEPHLRAVADDLRMLLARLDEKIMSDATD
jgi:hypothetical protein